MSSVGFPGVMELELQESLKLKRQRPQGGSWGAQGVWGVEKETRQAGVSEWDAEAVLCAPPCLAGSIFKNYDSYPIALPLNPPT